MFIYAEEKGYIEVIAYVYTAEFDEKIAEPIEIGTICSIKIENEICEK